jgi:Fuc2NAc and GlcNAc transferase
MLSTGLLALVASLVLTAVYLPLGRRWRQLDTPNLRSAHRRPVLSSGGIAVMCAFALSIVLGRLSGDLVLTSREQWALAPALLLCIAGARDDRRPLPVGLRLLLFLLLSGFVSVLYQPCTGVCGVLAVAALSLALTWLVNLFNFMDGIDGLAALQCSVVALALAALAWMGGGSAGYVAVAASVGAAYAGFLCFNWPPARLFMGDAGSLAAGYLLGWLGLWAWSEGWVAWQSWLLLMSPFLIDTGFTLVHRWWRGEAVTQAHSEHIYQQLARQWSSHRRVDLLLLMLQLLCLLPLSLLQAGGVLPAGPALALGLAPQLIALLLFMARGARLQ